MPDPSGVSGLGQRLGQEQPLSRFAELSQRGGYAQDHRFRTLYGARRRGFLAQEVARFRRQRQLCAHRQSVPGFGGYGQQHQCLVLRDADGPDLPGLQEESRRQHRLRRGPEGLRLRFVASGRSAEQPQFGGDALRRRLLYADRQRQHPRLCGLQLERAEIHLQYRRGQRQRLRNDQLQSLFGQRRRHGAPHQGEQPHD